MESFKHVFVGVFLFIVNGILIQWVDHYGPDFLMTQDREMMGIGTFMIFVLSTTFILAYIAVSLLAILNNLNHKSDGASNKRNV